MPPSELARLIRSLSAAADIVDAIDDPSMQAQLGWNLVGWSCEFIPWGVRFVFRQQDGKVTAAVVATALPESSRERLAKAYTATAWPTTLVMLG